MAPAVSVRQSCDRLMHCRVQHRPLPWPTERHALLPVAAAAMLLELTQCGLAGSGTALTGADTGARGQDDADVDAPPGVALPEDGGSPDDTSDATATIDATLPGDAAIADASRDASLDGRGGPLEGGISDSSVMSCGTSPCDLSTSVCCTCANCALPFPTGCFPSFPGCVPAGTYATLTCGGAANCSVHSQCCASFTNGSLAGASCQSSCSGGDVQLCASDGECPGNQTCTTLMSIPGFTGCQ
jgi:hypothetical protein